MENKKEQISYLNSWRETGRAFRKEINNCQDEKVKQSMKSIAENFEIHARILETYAYGRVSSPPDYTEGLGLLKQEVSV